MFKQWFVFLVVSVLSLCSFSCVGDENYTYVHPERRVISDRGCWTARNYGYNYQEIAKYDFFESTVHSQVALEKNFATAIDVARMAWSIEQAVKNKWYSDYKKQRDVMAILSHTHVIIAKDNEHLQQIWGHARIKQKLNGRMMLSTYSCFEPVNDTFFFTIVSSRFYKKDLGTVSHEMVHAASAAMFQRDADDDHVNMDLWKELSDNSVEAKALKIFYNKDD